MYKNHPFRLPQPKFHRDLLYVKSLDLKFLYKISLRAQLHNVLRNALRNTFHSVLRNAFHNALRPPPQRFPQRSPQRHSAAENFPIQNLLRKVKRNFLSRLSVFLYNKTADYVSILYISKLQLASLLSKPPLLLHNISSRICLKQLSLLLFLLYLRLLSLS